MDPILISDIFKSQDVPTGFDSAGKRIAVKLDPGDKLILIAIASLQTFKSFDTIGAFKTSRIEKDENEEHQTSERDFFDLLNHHEKISLSRIEKMTGYSHPTVVSRIKHLKSIGVLRWTKGDGITIDDWKVLSEKRLRYWK